MANYELRKWHVDLANAGNKVFLFGPRMSGVTTGMLLNWLAFAKPGSKSIYLAYPQLHRAIIMDSLRYILFDKVGAFGFSSNDNIVKYSDMDGVKELLFADNVRSLLGSKYSNVYVDYNHMFNNEATLKVLSSLADSCNINTKYIIGASSNRESCLQLCSVFFGTFEHVNAEDDSPL